MFFVVASPGFLTVGLFEKNTVRRAVTPKVEEIRGCRKLRNEERRTGVAVSVTSY